MKMLPDHYAHILKEIKRIATPEKIASHRQFILREGKAKDTEKRLRWDMFYYAGLSPYTSTLYTYLNDDHIDTALRSIVPGLEKGYI